MYRTLRLGLGVACLILYAIITILGQPAAAQSGGLVYVVPLEGEIDRALPLSMKIAFNDAIEQNAELIILEIDSYGGWVDASDDIKTTIGNSSIPVYAFVKKAISGGAFVALACERIYMQPGSALGAVEPVAGGETVTDEKTLSVIEGQMRAMAESQERDPQIASAMVRRDIAIPGIIERDRLLTLTATKALEVGYAEGIVASYSEIPALAGIGNPNYEVYTQPWAVSFARFLSSTGVSAILLAVGLAALVIEIFTAGFGVAGVISLVAFTLYFGSNIFIGVAQWEYIALFILGIILLISEAFVSGFGLLGGAGLICVAFSIVLSAETITQGFFTLGLSILLAIIITAIAFRFLRKSSLWNRLILSESETKERGYVGPLEMKELMGSEGVSITPLRPSGTVLLSNGKRVDALTDGGYISAETQVVVTGVSSGSVIVSPIK